MSAAEPILTGTVVMITGASQGLGAALAAAFADAGATVSLGARSLPALEALRSRIAARGGTALVRKVDVRSDSAVEDWVAATVEELGTPGVLVNNASLLGPRTPLAEHPLAEWQEVFDVNLTGTLRVTQAVLRSMVRAGTGSIINVSSGAATPPRTEWGAYGVSKSALDALSLNLAKELEGTGVRVNLVDPGAMRTAMRADAYPDEDPGTVKEPLAIAPLFLWLASGAARAISGRRFQADEWLRSRPTG